MNIWFTRREAALQQDWVKRFDPLHWRVDFPAGASASVVTEDHVVAVECGFLRKGDLVGLIFDSRDQRAHAAHARGALREAAGHR